MEQMNAMEVVQVLGIQWKDLRAIVADGLVPVKDRRLHTQSRFSRKVVEAWKDSQAGRARLRQLYAKREAFEEAKRNRAFREKQRAEKKSRRDRERLTYEADLREQRAREQEEKRVLRAEAQRKKKAARQARLPEREKARFVRADLRPFQFPSVERGVGVDDRGYDATVWGEAFRNAYRQIKHEYDMYGAYRGGNYEV